MSLYESSPMHNKVPVAKLSNLANAANKDKAVSATMSRTLTALSLLLDFAVLLFALNLQPPSSAAEFADKPIRRLFLRFPPASFLRPPPFPLHG